MGSLSYSGKALDTLPAFHRKRFVIFVEGKEDTPFWNIVLKAFGFSNFIVKIAGGSGEIDKYTDEIINNNRGIVVARDCDYTDLLGQQHNHPQIMYTYGYSFENSIYNSNNIAIAISIYARSQTDYTQEAEEWLSSFAADIRDLIVYDLASTKYYRGVKVLGRESSHFLKSRSSHLACSIKIGERLALIRSSFQRLEVDEAENLVNNQSKPLKYLIRGHFLTDAVLNFIKYQVKSITGRDIRLSAEIISAQLIGQYDSQCKETEDYNYLAQQLHRLTEHLNA